jgi:hypothetical protein
MSDKQKIKKDASSSGRAAELAKEFPKEVKLAAEAMERTARYRRTLVVEETQYGYEKIF